MLEARSKDKAEDRTENVESFVFDPLVQCTLQLVNVFVWYSFMANFVANLNYISD